MKEKRLKIIVEGRITESEMGDVKGGCDCGCEPNPCQSKAYLIFEPDPIKPCTGDGLIKYAGLICYSKAYLCYVMCGDDPKPPVLVTE